LDPANGDAQANLGHAYIDGQRFDLAVPHYEKALERTPGSAELRTQLVDARYHLGTALMRNGQRAQALVEWRQALRQAPGDLRLLHDVAWLLATCADPALRNGTEAIALGEHAVELSGGREPTLLSTLAAAYAEAGRFDQAIELEKRAIDRASEQGNAPLVSSLRSRLTLLQAKIPIRQ
jgi:tetratricopeptide (TPR) repeat protein